MPDKAEDKDAVQTPLELKKQELQALLKYGEEVSATNRNPDVTDKERDEAGEELKTIADQAEKLRVDVDELSKQEALARKVQNIGRKIFGDRKPDDDVTPEYRDAVAALMADGRFKTMLEDKNGRTTGPWNIGIEHVKATDPQVANPGDLVQQLRPGIVQPFVFPQRVGELFAQEQMSGSSISWLFVSDADGGADYAAFGGQKPDSAAMELDEDTIKASKIATTFVVPDEALDDTPALEGSLRQMLLVGPNGIGVKAEAQYIGGSGVGSPLQLKGVDALSPDDVSSEADVVLNVLRAIADIEDATGFPVTAVVVNPLDAFTIATVTNTNDDRLQYSPFGNGPRLPDIGVPWVKSKAAPQGTLYVGAWNASIRYTRTAVSIRATNQGLGLTDYNKTLFVAETRQALVHPYGGDVFRTVTIAS